MKDFPRPDSEIVTHSAPPREGSRVSFKNKQSVRCSHLGVVTTYIFAELLNLGLRSVPYFRSSLLIVD